VIGTRHADAHTPAQSARTSGWALIKTKTVRIWEFCAHEVPGIGIQSGSLE
jgi:hypothetical protein